MALVRLFYQPDSYKAPSTVYNQLRGDIGRWIQAGAKRFELFNEPNLAAEGLGTLWQNGGEFGEWLRQFAQMFRAEFPEAKLYYPGLSPGTPWTAQFAFSDAAWPHVRDYTDGMCMHAYTGIVADADAAAADVAGQVVGVQKRYALDRPLVVSECSVNRAADPEYKAQVYRGIDAALTAVPGVEAVCYFVSHWNPPPEQAAHGESWLADRIGEFYRAMP